MTFAFEGEYSQEVGPFEDRRCGVKVTGLLGPGVCDDMYGLLCEAKD